MEGPRGRTCHRLDGDWPRVLRCRGYAPRGHPSDLHLCERGPTDMWGSSQELKLTSVLWKTPGGSHNLLRYSTTLNNILAMFSHVLDLSLEKSLASKPETPIGKNTSIPKFTAALSTITKLGKQPECPSVGEGQLRHIYPTEYYWALKRRKSYPLRQQGWTWRALC